MSDNTNIKGGDELAFTKKNYTFLIAGFVTIVLGLFLMSGGGSDDPTVFSDAIFSAQRITVAPVVILAGYGLVLYAIMKKTTA